MIEITVYDTKPFDRQLHGKNKEGRDIDEVALIKPIQKNRGDPSALQGARRCPEHLPVTCPFRKS